MQAAPVAALGTQVREVSSQRSPSLHVAARRSLPGMQREPIAPSPSVAQVFIALHSRCARGLQSGAVRPSALHIPPAVLRTSDEGDAQVRVVVPAVGAHTVPAAHASEVVHGAPAAMTLRHMSFTHASPVEHSTRVAGVPGITPQRCPSPAAAPMLTGEHMPPTQSATPVSQPMH